MQILSASILVKDMSDQQSLGQVKSGKGRMCDAKWNPSSGEVYVKAPGGAWTRANGNNKAHTMTEAHGLAYSYAQAHM